MTIYEMPVLPQVCKSCKDIDCGSCDYALERFYIDRLDELKIQLKAAEKAIERYQQRKREIEEQIQQIGGRYETNG